MVFLWVDKKIMVDSRGATIQALRQATNAINDIMDDKTAAATQRWQRLMIQAITGRVKTAFRAQVIQKNMEIPSGYVKIAVENGHL